eukprot:8544638-Pyramimonas_sp.AAC.1
MKLRGTRSTDILLLKAGCSPRQVPLDPTAVVLSARIVDRCALAIYNNILQEAARGIMETTREKGKATRTLLWILRQKIALETVPRQARIAHPRNLLQSGNGLCGKTELCDWSCRPCGGDARWAKSGRSPLALSTSAGKLTP